jgi:hypothetical protein
MSQVKVLRRKDAPHVFFGWTAALARRTDVLEEAWLDTESGKTSLEQMAERPKPRPRPKPRRKVTAGRSRKANQATVEQAMIDLEDMTAGLDELHD